ncbi:GATOR complex protein wdr59 [Blomia tropicalis]|nr:GATOR complex protein wdr59 [Blomia tropicalis]
MVLQFWSTATISAEHKCQQAMCMATSNDGKVALISRRSIAIINTENILAVDYNIRRETKWDTTYSEFSTLQQNYLAITNAQTVQIFNTDDTSMNSLIHSLKGHTRTITDLNWSINEPTVLATASYDNYMHIWDLRDSRKPVQSMHSIAGATQVKWSKMNDYTLATSHEGDVRIWDKRKSNTPIHYITAHLSKINGIDWNPFRTSQFVTCSQDGSIKFWDISTLKAKSDQTLPTGLPVWKARYTPFENVLLTALVPQLRRAGENNSLWMWNITNLDQPLHSFAGHLDVVLDFGWNVKNELVTWAKDSMVRLWKTDEHMFQKSPTTTAYDNVPLVGGDSSNTNLTAANEEYQSDSGSGNNDLSRSSNPSPISSKFESTRSENEDSDVGHIPQSSITPNNIILNLSQEFSLVNQNIPNIMIEELNAAKRICIISTKSTVINCRLKIVFPINYPNNVIPQFIFLNENDNSSSNSSSSSKNLPDSMKKELLKVLQTTATSQVQRNRSCLEKCLRQFTQSFERLMSSNQLNITPPKTQTQRLLDLLPSHKYGSYLDASVPFPRTSGARFCSSEILVCFGRPPHLEQMNAPTEFTPRSLSALSAYLTSHVRAYNSNFQKESNALSISSFYLDSSKKRHKIRHKNDSNKSRHSDKAQNLCGPVSVFSVAKLLPISRLLAEQYILNSKDGTIGICEMNAKMATNHGRRDLCQSWNLIRLSAAIYLKNVHNNDQFLTAWADHPFGRKMIHSMIEHYALKCNDIQMAAMIACAFSPSNIKSENSYPFEDSSVVSPAEIMSNTCTFTLSTIESYGDWSLINSKEIKRTRSNSWSEYGDPMEYLMSKPEQHEMDHVYMLNMINPIEIGNILDSNLMIQYDYYKKIYADILYRWKLIEKRALLLKTVQSKILNEESDLSLPFATECRTFNCSASGKLCRNLVCSGCNRIPMECIICRLPVKGATNHCMKCGHGGHTIHMHEWFQTQNQCPTGCGCMCLNHL